MGIFLLQLLLVFIFLLGGGFGIIYGIKKDRRSWFWVGVVCLAVAPFYMGWVIGLTPLYLFYFWFNLFFSL